MGWIEKFSKASVHHFSMPIFDHYLLTLFLHWRKPRKPVRKRFFFKAMWTRETGYREVIEEAWDPLRRVSDFKIMD